MAPVFGPAVFDPAVFEALLTFSLEGTIDLEIEVEAETHSEFSFVGTLDLEVEVDSEFHSVFDFTGTIDLELEVEAGVTVHRLRVAGRTGIIIHKPDFTSPPGLAGPLEVFAWKTSRYQNKVGTWSASVPVDDQLIADDDDLDLLPAPVTRQIERGWRVSIVQENNIPLDIISEGYLLFQGIVERREYAIDEASARLDLAGSMRNLVLAGRATRQGLSYNGTPTAAAIIDDLVGGVQHIGTPGGAIYPAALANRSPKVTFNDISKLAALLKFTELTRTAYRESWDYDRPEFTPIDGPPGIYTLVNVEAADPGLDDLASAGFGIIGGPPRVRYEGQEIVNRIIPIGSDTPDGDLTLEFATLTEPFEVVMDLNPDGSPFWYIEDEASIERYGLVETKLIRTDVKNPSNNAVTRQKSADVLYSVAAGELLKRRSEQIFVTVPVANGSHVWALPGDCMALEYSGWVELESGRIAWMDIDRLFMVTERHDTGDASGIRGVEFVLAAPAIEYPVLDLPPSIKNRPPLSLPPLVPPDDIDKILPKKTLKFKVSADCCDDIEIDVIEEIVPVPPEDDEDETPPLPSGNPWTHASSSLGRAFYEAGDFTDDVFTVSNNTDDPRLVFLYIEVEQFEQDWAIGAAAITPRPPNEIPADPGLSGGVWSGPDSVVYDGFAKVLVWRRVFAPNTSQEVTISYSGALSSYTRRSVSVRDFTNIRSQSDFGSVATTFEVDQTVGPLATDMVVVLVAYSFHGYLTNFPQDLHWTGIKKAIAAPRIFYGIGPRLAEFHWTNPAANESAVFTWVLYE